MINRLQRLQKLLFNRPNHGVPAPKIFTAYEAKLVGSLFILACTLLWALGQNGAQEGVLGVVLIAGLAIYLSYTKYYCTYQPEMDRWGIRELACPIHPRQEYRVADRDLLISDEEVRFIARQYKTNIVHHPSPDNPAVLIYESKRHYEHRLLANRFASERELKHKNKH